MASLVRVTLNCKLALGIFENQLMKIVNVNLCFEQLKKRWHGKAILGFCSEDWHMQDFQPYFFQMED